ncbi:hypothetical protein [Novosphingobium rosa]|uniref:hypothetical protein n=1 Tax=Novosphingobium rosa TaxID=76978 RepID=UPI00082CBAFA|nr:hypothetical protein [Novosphingobium rosa]
MGTIENERWLSRRGEAIQILRKNYGGSALAPQDRLIEILWHVSRSMKSTGDLAAARSLDPTFIKDGLTMATALALPTAIAAFSASEGGLERCFFDVFETVCGELRQL